MKKINHRLYLPLFIMIVALLWACKKDSNNKPPEIIGVLNYAASPNDTAVQTVITGQWILVQGNNLIGVTQAFFGGIPAAINSTLITDKNIVIQIPFIPFQSVSKDKLNEITVVSESGTATYKINITGPPLISHVRNYDVKPNDTIVDAIVPGQHINIIGFNLENATRIAFQGLNVALTGVVYTDSSVIVTVPNDFSGADPSLSNKITYTTSIGTAAYSIIIYDPALLIYYGNQLYTFLTGGIGNKKTWVLDLDPATGNSKKFIGPIWWAGLDLGWDKQCGSGGSCWTYEVAYQGWFPAVKDYGTMTFQLKGNVVVEPVLTVTQKNGDAAQNGTFTGSFFLDIDAKTITFINVVPLNFGWQYIFTKAYIISLTADGMQLGFRDPVKSEYAVHNYVPQ